MITYASSKTASPRSWGQRSRGGTHEDHDGPDDDRADADGGAVRAQVGAGEGGEDGLVGQAGDAADLPVEGPEGEGEERAARDPERGEEGEHDEVGADPDPLAVAVLGARAHDQAGVSAGRGGTYKETR